MLAEDSEGEPFQLFNLATMSGVFPGTHTMVYQRVRLQPATPPDAPVRWARIQWYDDPPSCTVELEVDRADRGDLSRTDAPLLRIAIARRVADSEAPMADIHQRLQQALDGSRMAVACVRRLHLLAPL